MTADKFPALEAYRMELASRGLPIPSTPGTLAGLADAALTEQIARAERAEADLEFVTAVHDGCTEQLTQDHAAREQAEREIERLRLAMDEGELVQHWHGLWVEAIRAVRVAEEENRQQRRDWMKRSDRYEEQIEVIPALVRERDELRAEVRRLRSAIDPRNRR